MPRREIIRYTPARVRLPVDATAADPLNRTSVICAQRPARSGRREARDFAQQITPIGEVEPSKSQTCAVAGVAGSTGLDHARYFGLCVVPARAPRESKGHNHWIARDHQLIACNQHSPRGEVEHPLAHQTKTLEGNGFTGSNDCSSGGSPTGWR